MRVVLAVGVPAARPGRRGGARARAVLVGRPAHEVARPHVRQLALDQREHHPLRRQVLGGGVHDRPHERLRALHGAHQRARDPLQRQDHPSQPFGGDPVLGVVVRLARAQAGERLEVGPLRRLRGGGPGGATARRGLAHRAASEHRHDVLDGRLPRVGREARVGEGELGQPRDVLAAHAEGAEPAGHADLVAERAHRLGHPLDGLVRRRARHVQPHGLRDRHEPLRQLRAVEPDDVRQQHPVDDAVRQVEHAADLVAHRVRGAEDRVGERQARLERGLGHARRGRRCRRGGGWCGPGCR